MWSTLLFTVVVSFLSFSVRPGPVVGATSPEVKANIAARLAARATILASGAVSRHALVSGSRGALGGAGWRIRRAATRTLNSTRPFRIVAIGGSPTVAHAEGNPTYYDLIRDALNEALPLPDGQRHSVEGYGFVGTNACMFAYRADAFAALLDADVDLIIFENNINSGAAQEKQFDGTLPKCIEALMRTFFIREPECCISQSAVLPRQRMVLVFSPVRMILKCKGETQELWPKNSWLPHICFRGWVPVLMLAT